MTRTIFIAAALALAVTLPAIPAQAQTRVFVSAAGSDSNNCLNTMTPCRHFQNAYDKMPNGGEIDVLDPANYGALAATHTLGIVGRGWATLSPVAGQAAITINAGLSDKIAISGLTLDGANISNTIGIDFKSGASLTVRDSVIQNFTRYGILFEPNNPGKISVSNTHVSDNNYGIYIGPLGTGNTRGVLDHVHTDNNENDGITVASAVEAEDVRIVITDSVSAGNGGTGVITTSATQNVFVMVRNSTIAGNAGDGLGATRSDIAVTRSGVVENLNHGWNQGVAAQVFSYNDNTDDFNNPAVLDAQTIAQYK